MPKNILLRVSCHNSFVDDVPETFYCTMDGVLKLQIKTLHSKLLETHGSRICKFEIEGDWSRRRMALEGLVTPATDEAFDSVVAELQKQWTSVDSPTLNVTRTGFYFTALPKHGVAMNGLETRRVPIGELDSDTLFVDLD